MFNNPHVCQMQDVETAAAEQPEGNNDNDTMDDVDAELQALAEVKSYSMSLCT